jgi:hypothetical protein
VLSILVMGLVGFLNIHMVRFGGGPVWVWFLYVILWDCMYVLKVVVGMCLLLGHPVMVHLGMPSSIPAHWQNLSILFICGCMYFISLVIMAKSYAYAAELSLYCDVLSLYPKLLLSSHLSSGSRDMIKRYGLSVSPCMVPLCM